jgi:hypothetical protein
MLSRCCLYLSVTPIGHSYVGLQRQLVARPNLEGHCIKLGP